MKETIFEIEQLKDQEKVVYHFQPNQQFEAIKCEIMKRYKQKKPSIEPPYSYHVGGLPSPPVEEKKITIELPPSPKDSAVQSPVESNLDPTLSIDEIKEKIRLLQQEKHELFQVMKQVMAQEEIKKKQQQLLQQQQQQQQQEKTIKKKSRWAPVTPDTPTYNNINNSNNSYFYPRPRYNPYQPRPRHSRPPF